MPTPLLWRSRAQSVHRVRSYGLWALALWLLATTGAWAQTSTIGSTAVPVVAPATSSYFYGPIYRSLATSTFNYSRYAHLYTAQELGIPAGAVITQLEWLKSDGGQLTGNNVFKVLLSNSAQTTLGTTSQTWDVLSAGSTQVYSSTTQQITGAAGTYFSVALAQPFTYTGGNLLVLTDHEKQGTASAVINFVVNPAAGFGLGYADSAPLTGSTSLTSASYGANRPTLRITYAPGGPCTTPPTAGTTLATANSVCAGTTVGLSLQGASFGNGQTYQWQESTNGTTFTDLAGATSPAYTTAPLTATRYYRARLTCSGQTAFSTVAQVTVVVPTYATLPVVESFENTWAGTCDTRDVPNNNWRNSPATGNSSWRRDDDGASANWTSPTIGVYTPSSSQGARSARFHSYYAGANALGNFDLYVNLSGAGNKVLTFDYINTAGNDSLKVLVSTDGGLTFGAPVLKLGNSGTVAQGFTPRNVSIASNSATTVIRFQAKVTTTFTSDIGIDNVAVDVLAGAPNCVINLSPANNATGVVRTPTLTWASGGGVPTSYDVYFGTTPTPPLVGNQTGTSYTPATALAGGTDYYYQIVPRNSAGAATGCPVVKFTTGTTFVYCTANLGGSSCSATDNISAVSIGGTTLNNPNTTCNTANGSTYTQFPATGSTTATLLRGLSYQVSVTVTSASITSVWIDFNQNGTFEANEWTQISASGTANQAATAAVSVPLTAVLGPTTMRVRSRTNGSPNGATDACTEFFSGETEEYIVTIGAAPSCAPPSGLSAANVSTTSATLAFVPGTGGTSYSVIYGPQGFNPATAGTTVTTTGSSVNVTGLTANTTYQFYVRKDCGGGTLSQLAGPFTFQTLCLAPVYATLPVVESFENTWVDGCGTRDIPTTSWRNTPVTGNNSWRRDDDGLAGGWASPTSWAYAPTGSTGARSARFHSGQASSGQVGTLDVFVNLSQAGAKQLSFDYVNTSGSDSLTVHLSTDGGATFGPALLRLGVSGTVAAGFTPQAVVLTSTAATAVVRFRGRADFGVTDIGLDNVRLESAAGCLTPVNLAVTGVTTTTATVTWQGTGTGAYTLQYGPVGFAPGQGTTVSSATSPYTLTGLQPGTQYQFYVQQACGTAQSGLAGPVVFATQIANDDPCGAIALALGSDCTTATQTTNAGATTTAPNGYANGGATGCGPAGLTLPRDVWFRFRTTASGRGSTEVTLSVTGTPANVLRVFTAASCSTAFAPLANGCAASASSAAAAPALALTGLTPNTDYYVQVAGYFNTAAQGNFSICAVAPSNCPVPVGPAATTTSSTATLTWSVAAPTPSGTFTVEYGPRNFTIGAGTRITGISGTSTTLSNLLPDTEYCFYVRQECGPASGTSAFTGPTCFRTAVGPAANDEPCNATTVTMGTGAYGPAVAATTVGATFTTPNGYSAIGCALASAPRDVWFRVTTPATNAGTMSIIVTGNPAGQVRVFSAASCNGPFTQVACKASNASNTTAGGLVVTGLSANTTYYVSVSGFGTNDTQGAFTIQAGTGVLANANQLPGGEVTVFPNPTHSGTFVLALSGAGSVASAQAVLVNSLGQTVLAQPVAVRGGAAQHTFEVSSLAKGLYTLRVQVGSHTITRKVVID